MKSLHDAPFVDLLSLEFEADAASLLDALRRQSAIVRTPLGCLVITREQVHTLLGDSRLRSSVLDLARLQGVSEGPLHELLASTILAVDGADHARLRRLVNRSFTPKAVAPYRPVMRAVAAELIDAFPPSRRCEFMADFADHYPISVFCHLLGVPVADHERFARWGDTLTYVLSLELSLRLEEVSEAAAGLSTYLDDLIKQRASCPRDDLVIALVAATDAGERLSALELRAMLGGLLFAGYDTTRNQLGLAMSLFCEHPDQWRLLAEHPDLVAAAVEEVMRVAGVVAAVPRFATCDVEVDDYLIPAGTLVMLSLSAANHDPEVYRDPEAFDITAAREPHMSFGGGFHYCLGASVARAEMQEALRLLAVALPEVALDGETQWRPMTGIYGPARLPLRFACHGVSGEAPIHGS